jgi:chitin disaccharide deacetylase
MEERVLIVNADDFGRSPGVNRGVIRAHEGGIVTSATLMVRWPAAEEAARYGRESSLGVGLHVDLGEWEELEGEWHSTYEVVSEFTEDAVAEEIERQLDRFQSLMGRAPTHIDSHQHVHNEDPVRTAVQRAAQRLGVPIRGLSPGLRYVGFHARDGRGNPKPDSISVEALVRTIEGLPVGVTELGCHPAAEADHHSAYGEERLVEVATLCDPRVADAIERRGVTLSSFDGLGRQGGTAPQVT